MSQIATLAGGCFWGVQELLRQLPGVIKTTAGYTGGTTPNPTYHDVKTGTTGHAEAVQVEFDPEILSYEELLHTFFRLHDPTTPNRQGNDIGSQYRSAIFTHTDTQHKTAETAKTEATSRWKDPIITEIVPFTTFTPAEDDHQDYLQKHPGGYTCHFLRPEDHPT